MLVASSNFLVPNGTFIVELVAFLIVVGVLAKWVLPPINARMEERQAAIRQALADAEEAKRRSAEAEEEYKRIIGEARTQARSVVEEANKMAEQARAERRQQAEAEYERIVGSASADIEAQARRAQEELRQQAADLAITVAERVLGEGIDRQAQANLINRTIDEVAASAGAARENA
ncbi:MAG TPA: F0F1 ATP synthase subunit B [Acidimicrobiales bacterium]|nr:F0F1 ATP synthase subunit B [Acidimicrobiales bacterium]